MLIAHADLEPVILGENAESQCCGPVVKTTQMWNADIDYAYARTPETVSGAHALTVQKPVTIYSRKLERDVGDVFSGVL